MSEPTQSSGAVPFSIMGRSPFDETRLRWQGAGNIVLALYCLFGAGGAGGIVFGILFISLAVATWVITRFGSRDWYSIPPTERYIAGTGAIIGVAAIYLTFGIFFLTIWFIMLIADWMS
jgi:hypothetical protein